MIITGDLWQLQSITHEDFGHFGDEPGWHFWSPEVMRRVGGAPSCAMPKVTDTRQPHTLRLRAWGPLLPLLHYHLGWLRVDIGLARWALAGFDPNGDPTLNTVSELWGPALPAFTFWYLGSPHANEHATATVALQHLQAAREDAAMFGPDNLHLGWHYQAAVAEPERRAEELAVLQVNEPGHASLVLPVHRGWYRLLEQAGSRLQPLPNGRSWRVDVTIVPIGLIGQFRRSRDSGRWFHGRHRAHELGFDV
ncbi:hypothetical protein LKO27_10260 [Tessaracoccus sp. OS52]|uniref:hypothetical protein n=1 Tax=Tessaracoccus sp. OS52 TaxID=2886691 RepID=UPI001D12AAB8|nr:hypothetical protein [Tessaracoccus sp. OS52]MCC2593788.1 hypothetical protein [Tessaracoccus sp. OS52]